MIIIKSMIKVLLLPLWIVLTALWLAVKVIISGYSFIKTIIGIGLILLIAGTIIYYQDWVQVAFLAGIMGFMFPILVAGTFVEVTLDHVRKRIINL